jgi:hypothetical protein
MVGDGTPPAMRHDQLYCIVCDADLNLIAVLWLMGVAHLL